MQALQDLIAPWNLAPEALIPFGRDKAKLDPAALAERPTQGKLILVTAMSPSPSGEGKTTVSIGLADALKALDTSVSLALREPSLGPCFGFKGGATGGGKAQLHPNTDINLHFNGDFHAISTAHNLLAALIDNHLFRGNALDIDSRKISWNRVIDLNDRALREVVVGLGQGNGFPRQTAFDITPASEIMAILCLAKDRQDLKARLGTIQIGLNRYKEPVLAQDLEAEDMLALVLKDALAPNLVQTHEGTPALIHGGPFANIAHGCNSVIATRSALQLADYVVTEAGFGSDLGAEKFFHIKCHQGGFEPAAVVMVVTLKALKYHGGVKAKALFEPNPDAVERGLANLQRHCENMQKFGHKPIIAYNPFGEDTPEEARILTDFCQAQGLSIARSSIFQDGGQGALELAKMVIEQCQNPPSLQRIYPLDLPISQKLEMLAQTIYRAGQIELTPTAKRQIKAIEKQGLGHLPICVAKTQYSFSDNPTQVGAPTDFTFQIRDARLSRGAGFVVLLAGDIMTMPGLPKAPQARFEY